ncbi:hypothetical protein COCHEDRAFT_1087765, partial [Bipolaris maydis C5]
RVCHCFLATTNGFTLLAINDLAKLDDLHKQGAVVRRDSVKRKYTKGNMEYMPKEKRYGDNDVAGERRSKKRENQSPHQPTKSRYHGYIFLLSPHPACPYLTLRGETASTQSTILRRKKKGAIPPFGPLVPKGSTRLHPFSNIRLCQNDPPSTT